MSTFFMVPGVHGAWALTFQSRAGTAVAGRSATGRAGQIRDVTWCSIDLGLGTTPRCDDRCLQAPFFHSMLSIPFHSIHSIPSIHSFIPCSFNAAISRTLSGREAWLKAWGDSDGRRSIENRQDAFTFGILITTREASAILLKQGSDKGYSTVRPPGCRPMGGVFKHLTTGTMTN